MIFRCKIPECDGLSSESGGSIEFRPSWLDLAIPKQNTTISSCLRYNTSADYPSDDIPSTNECNANYFNRSEVINCHDVVYKTDEVNIQNAVIINVILLFEGVNF